MALVLGEVLTGATGESRDQCVFGNSKVTKCHLQAADGSTVTLLATLLPTVSLLEVPSYLLENGSFS